MMGKSEELETPKSQMYVISKVFIYNWLSVKTERPTPIDLQYTHYHTTTTYVLVMDVKYWTLRKHHNSNLPTLSFRTHRRNPSPTARSFARSTRFFSSDFR